jgi:hypothetical protein
LGGDLADAVDASVAIVHAVVPSTQRGGVVAHGAAEAAVELRLDPVERVRGERRAARRAAAALQEHQAAQLRVARLRGPMPVRSKSVARSAR